MPRLDLDPRTPSIIVPLFAHTLPELAAQAAAAAAAPEADIVELRLDPLPQGDWFAATLAASAAMPNKPLLVTLRTVHEGGLADLGDPAYAATLLALMQQHACDALDIEWRCGPGTVGPLCRGARASGIQAVVSEHHFDATPPLNAMKDTLCAMADAGADIAKLAVMPKTRADAALLLQATALAAKARPKTPLITMSMGPLGAATRFCGGAFGSAATFGTLGHASAPGQPPAALLRQKCLNAADLGAPEEAEP